MRGDCCFFFSSRRRHTRLQGDWSSDVCSSDLEEYEPTLVFPLAVHFAEAVDARIYGLPYKQFLIEKSADSGHAFRSEERRVGKECRSGWAACADRGRGGTGR